MVEGHVPPPALLARFRLVLDFPDIKLVMSFL